MWLTLICYANDFIVYKLLKFYMINLHLDNHCLLFKFSVSIESMVKLLGNLKVVYSISIVKPT